MLIFLFIKHTKHIHTHIDCQISHITYSEQLYKMFSKLDGESHFYIMSKHLKMVTKVLSKLHCSIGH